MKKNILIISSLIVLTNLFGLMFTPALAQTGDIDIEIKDQLDPIKDVSNPKGDVTPTTLAEIIARIIKVALSLLGIIFLVLIIYAGFMWMTSAGNEERISKAKKIMAAAIIGLAIVMAAYAITIFVIDNLMGVTDTKYETEGWFD